jgi:hypothetical protein
MKHARPDYDRIQDPAGLIPEGEPVFLLRAQDKHFIGMLEYYRAAVLAQDGDPKIVKAVEQHIERAKQWPKRKAPDMPELNAEQ